MNESSGQRQGSITVICGCMFSGKSERLLERLAEARAQSISSLAFKHDSDERYAPGEIVSHSGRHGRATAVHNASMILENVGQARLVVIDEGQFFDDGLIQVCQQLARQGREVVVAGLDLDSWGLPFGPMDALAAIADRVIHTQAVCGVCGASADHTQRLAPVLPGSSMIGGSGDYEPRCSRCFQPPPIELRR